MPPRLISIKIHTLWCYLRARDCEWVRGESHDVRATEETWTRANTTHPGQTSCSYSYIMPSVSFLQASIPWWMDGCSVWSVGRAPENTQRSALGRRRTRIQSRTIDEGSTLFKFTAPSPVGYSVKNFLSGFRNTFNWEWNASMVFLMSSSSMGEKHSGIISNVYYYFFSLVMDIIIRMHCI